MDNAEFLEHHYPNYHTCDQIGRIDDLTKILTGETYIDGEDSDTAHMLETEYGGNENDPAILEDLIDLNTKCFLLALDNATN